MDVNVEREHILITAFWLPPAAFTNERQYQMLENAGFNFLQNVHSTDLQTKELNLQMAQLAYEHNMQVSACDSRFISFSSMTAAQIKSIVGEYADVPGVGGVYVLDEPTQGTAANLYGPVFQAIKAQVPNLYAHINFLPSSEYASEAAFQSDLTSFVAAAGAGNVDYLMYDRYSFPDNGTGSCDYNGMMNNLNSLWLAGTQTGVKTGFYLQTAGIRGLNARTNQNELRFQIYTALGFGIKQLSYFTYWSVGALHNFSDGVIDVDGNPTDLYAPVSELNSEVNHLSDTLINLNAEKVYFSGADIYGMTRVPPDFLVHPVDSHNIMYSLMVDKNGGTEYLMIVNTDYKNPVMSNLQMNAEAVGSMEEVLHTTGQLSGMSLLANGDTLSLDFLPGGGRLFRLSPPA